MSIELPLLPGTALIFPNGNPERVMDADMVERAVEARERILLARIAELEAALSGCVDLAEWWINYKREPHMCERDYRTWLALGHHSNALSRAKAAIAAAQGVK